MEYNTPTTFVSIEPDLLKHLPDDSLVERFKTTGRPAYFAEIFRRHRSGICRCCMAVVRDRETAADQTQATFLKALEGIDGYTGGNLRGWLITIAKHLCFNWLRAKNRGPQALTDAEFADVRSYLEEAVVSNSTVRELLRPLSEPQQRCLKLFWLQGFTYEETAALTGLETHAVRSHIQNGMRRMRKAWADAGKK